MSKNNNSLDNISIDVKPRSEYIKEFDININRRQKGKLICFIDLSLYNDEEKNENGTISIGSLNSVIHIEFENKQPLERLKKYYLSFKDFLVFLTGRKNVDFDVKLFHDNENNSTQLTSDCFIAKRNNDVYNGNIQKTIQIDSLGDKFPDIFNLFNDKKNSPFLWYLPENNSMDNRISVADVLNIATAFEIEFVLDKDPHKKSITDNMIIPEFGKSKLSPKILFLFKKANIIKSDISQIKKSIAEFVKLRNNIIHNGDINWGNSGKFSLTLIKTYTLLHYYEQILIKKQLLK
jgi:hypothetical protein